MTISVSELRKLMNQAHMPSAHPKFKFASEKKDGQAKKKSKTKN